MGLAKAVSESCALRLIGQWAGPLLGFALAGGKAPCCGASPS